MKMLKLKVGSHTMVVPANKYLFLMHRYDATIVKEEKENETMKTIIITSDATKNTVSYNVIDENGEIVDTVIKQVSDTMLGVDCGSRQRRAELQAVINAAASLSNGDILKVMTIKDSYVQKVIGGIKYWVKKDFKNINAPIDPKTCDYPDRPNADMLKQLQAQREKGVQLYYDFVA